jgi:hypothetical protein
MGKVYSFFQVGKNYYNIYLEDSKQCVYPIQWPDTFAQLMKIINTKFDYYPDKNKLHIDDASSSEKVMINSELSYQALVPKHRKLESGEINIFYVYIDIPSDLK